MSGLLNILRNKIFRLWFKAFFIRVKSAETSSSEGDLSSREWLSGIRSLLRHPGKTWLGEKVALVCGEELHRHQKEPLGQCGRSSWMMLQAMSWLDSPLDLCRQHILIPLWICTAGSGQPNKSIFKLMSLNMLVLCQFLPSKPKYLFFFFPLIFTHKLFQLKEKNTIFWLHWRTAVNDTYSHLLFISLQKPMTCLSGTFESEKLLTGFFLNLGFLPWGALSARGVTCPQVFGERSFSLKLCLVWQKESDFKGSCFLIYVQSWASPWWCPRGVPGHP